MGVLNLVNGYENKSEEVLGSPERSESFSAVGVEEESPKDPSGAPHIKFFRIFNFLKTNRCGGGKTC